MRFVEVIQVEDEVALRRGIKPEIPKVRIAADNRLDAGARHAIEILCHQGGRSSKESIRRDGHPSYAHRNQALKATRVGLLDEIDRIRPIGFRSPAAKLATLDLLPQCSASRQP